MRLVLLFAILCGACSTKKPREDTSKTHEALRFAAEGTVQSLRFDGGALFFCDKSGSHRVDVKAGIAVPDGSPCPTHQEPNASCSALNVDVSVRALRSEPNDIVDVGASSFPLRGRVHDCAAVGDHLAVGTGSAVEFIDTTQNISKVISEQGSDRVAVTQNWIAWTENSAVRVAPIP